jgi:hypothetical protein
MKAFNKMKEVKSMKKFFLAIAMVAMLGFVAVPANALIGVPDDVPGTDIVVPFFYVSMPGFGSENTLITVTEVKGFRLFAPPDPFSTQVLGWVQTIDSETVFDFGFNLTRFDVWAGDALALINQMSPAGRAALEIDVDGDGVNDHWAGYIYLFNNTWPRVNADGVWLMNNLISNCYQVYLAGGMAAGYNGVSMEWADPNSLSFPANLLPQTLDPFFSANFFSDWAQIYFGNEVYSANALLTGKSLIGSGFPWFAVAPVGGLNPPIADATYMRLMARYFMMDNIAESLMMIWTEQAMTPNTFAPFPLNLVPIPLPGSVHCNFFDENERVLSANIPLDNELNIIRVRDVMPGGLHAAFPWAGWIDITTPDRFNGGNYNTDFNVNGILDGAERQWLGYSWQRAYGPAAEAWEVIHPMHRETNDTATWPN